MHKIMSFANSDSAAAAAFQIGFLLFVFILIGVLTRISVLY